jgi:hypothetical protein
MHTYISIFVSVNCRRIWFVPPKYRCPLNSNNVISITAPVLKPQISSNCFNIYNISMSKYYLSWRMVSSGLLRRVALVRTDVSEEPDASFIRVTNLPYLIFIKLIGFRSLIQFSKRRTVKGPWRRRTEKKTNSILATGHGGLKICEILRVPHCLPSRLTDGVEVVNLTRWPPIYSAETIFLY